jgi:dolichyl-phosphate-mannose--protein O-mannosyl transferase
MFDVHPPHGKQLIAIGAWLGGFDGAFTFERIGQPYGDVPIFALRLVPAIAGILIPTLFLLLLRGLGASPPIALLGGLLLVFDNALVVESRMVVFDSLLVASTLGTLVCFLGAQRSPSRRLGWLAAAGALGGLAVGIKLTGLATAALIGLCLLPGLGVVTATTRERLRQAGIMATAGAIVYVAGWVAQWLMLTEAGPGDAFYLTTGRLWHDLTTAHRLMLEHNVGLSATHPDASPPWTWPWMQVAPYLWQGTTASMYLVGNPVVWWGTAAIFLAALVQIFVLRPLGLPLPAAVNQSPQPWVALAGWTIALLPLLPVTRVLFLYHYLTPLVLSVAFVLLWLDRLGWARPGGWREQRTSYHVVVALVVVGFFAMSPLTYGISLGQYDEWLAAVIRSWR